ncbi:sce7726 family protein [Paenibacillus tepidiphilus]|uniref:sce7726 family protein n=1 Tax=Paenibacillus tepidiphilus TaxID=2608683 RepID=UPI00123A3C5F|nr:sce7726 family protein [Paenibacillus tepidiphilus]
MDTNNMVLNRFFSRSSISDWTNDLTNEAYTATVDRYLGNPGGVTNKKVIGDVYNIITKNYRNEYFYKNTLLNKLLLGRHSLKTTTALTEVLVHKSKADFVLINGKAVVYEIKTELDNLDRLESQLNDYYKGFDNVCVVTCESNYKRVFKILEQTSVGIYILTQRNTLSLRKPPIADGSKLDYRTMFKMLRKQEFESILLRHFHELPVTEQVHYYKACCEQFRKIPIELAYRYMLLELKRRVTIDSEAFQALVPYEMKFSVYFSNFKKEDYFKLNAFLAKKFGG